MKFYQNTVKFIHLIHFYLDGRFWVLATETNDPESLKYLYLFLSMNCTISCHSISVICWPRNVEKGLIRIEKRKHKTKPKKSCVIWTSSSVFSFYCFPLRNFPLPRGFSFSNDRSLRVVSDVSMPCLLFFTVNLRSFPFLSLRVLSLPFANEKKLGVLLFNRAKLQSCSTDTPFSHEAQKHLYTSTLGNDNHTLVCLKHGFIQSSQLPDFKILSMFIHIVLL